MPDLLDDSRRWTNGPRVPLGRAWDTLDPVLALLRSVPEVHWAEPVGEVRRGVDFVGHLELVAATEHPDLVRDTFESMPWAGVPGQEERRLIIEIERVHVGIRCVPLEAAGAALLHATGSDTHLEILRARARQRGHVLDRGGLRKAGTPGLIAESEDAIYRALDLPTIAPELRNDGDEVIAAETGTLPQLVSAADIRGDLHMHSHWSDGHDAIEAMVLAAVGLGYEYIAITDHSPSSAAVRNLTAEGVERQAEEIASLRERHPQIAILHGCEVDILEDGSLDFPDRILEQLDIVLASLHDSHGHDPATLLRRYESAMRHPLVTLLTHPTNRSIPHRAGYDLDYERLFQLAIETGTLLEIDGAPSHLDLDATRARQAARAGVRLTIDSDCHRANRLGRQMQLGVVTARRGWVAAAQVLNTRPLVDVLAQIAAKRAGQPG